MSVAEEFFSERKYVIEAGNGEEFVKALDGLLSGANSLDQGGISYAPYKADDVRYFFRGQTDGDFGLNSSLYRVLQEDILPDATPKNIETQMKEAEKRVLLEARKQGIGRHLTSLELLTVLQHHLVPTRLIDVSAAWKVALYFASEAKDQLDGRIFVIATKPSLWSKFSGPKDDSPSWPDTDEHPWQQTTWPVILPFTDPRMISQQGYFLVGGLATNTGGHHLYWSDTIRHPPRGNASRTPLTQQELREVSTLMIKFPMIREGDVEPLAKLEKDLRGRWTAAGMTILIPAALKPQIRNVLKNEHGIYMDSIYPPIDESLRLLKHVAGNQPGGGR